MGLGSKQGGIPAREGVAGVAGEEPDYRAEDGAGKDTDILQERRGSHLDILGGP